LNFKNLSSESVCVDSYDDSVNNEHNSKDAKKVFALGDLRLYECPVSFITEETAFMMKAVFLSVDTKALYFGGGIADQPEWFVRALEVFSEENDRYMKNKSTLKNF